MELKKINEESFSSIASYLEYLVPYVSSFENLTFITTENAAYMAVPMEPFIGDEEHDSLNPIMLVRNDGRRIDVLGVHANETGEFENIILNDINYRFKDESKKQLERIRMDNGNTTIMGYEPCSDTSGILYYIQGDNASNTLCGYTYGNEGHTLNSFLNYINSRMPNKISLEQSKKLLGFINYKRAYHYADIGYNKYVRTILNMAYARATDGVPISDIVDKDVFELTIPDEMKSLYLGQNTTVNESIVVANEYKKSLHL